MTPSGLTAMKVCSEDIFWSGGSCFVGLKSDGSWKEWVVLDSDRKSRKVKVRKKGKSLGIKTLHVGDFN